MVDSTVVRLCVGDAVARPNAVTGRRFVAGSNSLTTDRLSLVPSQEAFRGHDLCRIMGRKAIFDRVVRVVSVGRLANIQFSLLDRSLKSAQIKRWPKWGW